jgi:HD-like signal output (HDOD) protein
MKNKRVGWWKRLVKWWKGEGRMANGGWRIAKAEGAKRMKDEEILAALAVDEGHPVLTAVMELARRAEEEARLSARSAVENHAELSYYLGAEWGLENLREYIGTARAEGIRRAREAEEQAVE